MRIAVSFDGTIVESRYPEIGQEKPDAINVLRRLSDEGNKIILWTARAGNYLEEAIEWCMARGLEFYAVNANHPDGVISQRIVAKSPKIVADVFIDCHNLGGLPDWDEIYVKANERRRELQQKYKSRPENQI